MSLLLAVVCAVPLVGQVQVRVGRGGVVLADPAQRGNADGGVAVQMFESPNLDRYLRKAQDLIGREDYAGAIKVLQDVVDGRTLADEEPQPGSQPGGTQPKVPTPAEAQAASPLPFDEDDPAHAVFSNDDRLYRPVRRLCQELLAALPSDGLSLYRQKYEAAAAERLAEGLRRRDVRVLEEVYNRYFVTLSAARALNAAGDLLMHRGRFRGAVQTYRTLLEVYPAESRAQVTGLSELYASVKIALCYLQLGERAKAGELLDRLAAEQPDASVRVMGELVGLADLRGSDLFAGAVLATTPSAAAPAPAIRTAGDTMVALWEHRFEEPAPYRSAQRQRNERVFFVNGNRSTGGAAPRPKHLSPGASVRFDGRRVLFMDHFRLRASELGTGLMLAEGDGELKVPRPDASKARNRYAVYDHLAQRVVLDGAQAFAVTGRKASGNAIAPLLRNDLVAYDRQTLVQRWSSDQWSSTGSGSGPAGDYRDVTFLAAPTAFGQRLFAPILVRGVYAVQCLDADSGEPLFRAHLHHGGSQLARAPSVPVEVHMGVAYMLTNSGTIGAVDAYTGSTLWIRKYEREHPLRPRPRSKKQTARQGVFPGAVYREISLEGFAPSEIEIVDGRLIVAPSDGNVLLCLDGASGEVIWMITRPETNAYLVGHNSRHLFIAGGEFLMALDLSSGVRLWNKKLPRAGGWHGRGFVTEQAVIVPGERCCYSLPVSGEGAEAGEADWRRIELRPASVGAAPMEGAANLFAQGPYLVACYESGIEVYGSLAALRERAAQAEEPLARARLFVQARDLRQAIETLETVILDEQETEQRRRTAMRSAFPLVRDVAMDLVDRSENDAAKSMMSRCDDWALDVELRQQCQLARVELLLALGEAAEAERQRDVLYAMMEGRK